MSVVMVAGSAGDLFHCGYPAVWKDCPEHENDCYLAVCRICGLSTPPDCKEER